MGKRKSRTAQRERKNVLNKCRESKGCQVAPDAAISPTSKQTQTGNFECVFFSLDGCWQDDLLGRQTVVNARIAPFVIHDINSWLMFAVGVVTPPSWCFLFSLVRFRLYLRKLRRMELSLGDTAWRPKIDFSFVKIPFLGLSHVVLMEVYKSIRLLIVTAIILYSSVQKLNPLLP